MNLTFHMFRCNFKKIKRMAREKTKKEKPSKHHVSAAKYRILKEFSESECTTDTKTEEYSTKYKKEVCSCRSCIRGLYTASGRMVVISSPASMNNDSQLETITTETSEKQILNKRSFKKPPKCLRRIEENESNIKRSRQSFSHLPKETSLSTECYKRREKKKSKLKSVDPCCPLCAKPFVCPILLPCAHTFCKDCVTVFVETSDGKNFSCPVCSTDISLMGSDEELFCPNFIVLRTIESDEGDNRLCSVCDLNQEARYFCEQCSDLLCHECKERHRVVKSTKEHPVKRITSDTDISSAVKKRYFCSEHEKEQLLLHCLQCQQSVCRECALKHHHGDNHNCIPIAEAAKRYREILQRKLYSLKSRSPSLQLSLMDVKRVKKLLKDQVRIVRQEVGESIKRMMKNIKEREKILYQNVVQAYRVKAKSLNEHRDVILIELEQFEAASRLLQQLEHHENNVEMLQMKTTIDKTLTKLDKPVYSFELEQDTLLFKSNEKEVLAAIDRHGEVFHFCDKHKKDTLNDLFSRNQVKNLRSNENKSIIISDFDETVSSSVGSSQDGRVGNFSNARTLRARAHWRILQFRVKDIIADLGKVKVQTNDSLSSSHGTLSNGVHCKFIYLSNKKENQSAISKIQEDNTKYDVKSIENVKMILAPQSLEKQAKRERAFSNWLLVQSKIYDIIDYGRMKGLIPFNSRNIYVKSNRRRENRFLLKVRHYRATTIRARANWKILISKVTCENKKHYETTQNLSWDDYRKKLTNTKNKAASNKVIAGKVRASANWLLVKARLRDVLLIEKYGTSKDCSTSKNDFQNSNLMETYDGLPSNKTMTSGKRSETESLKSLYKNQGKKNTQIDALKNWKQLCDTNSSKKEEVSSSLNRLNFEKVDGERDEKSFNISLNQSASSLNSDLSNWRKLVAGKTLNPKYDIVNDDLKDSKNSNAWSDWNSLIKGKQNNECNGSLTQLKPINTIKSNSMLNVNEDSMVSQNMAAHSNWKTLLKTNQQYIESTPIKTCAKPPTNKSKIPRLKNHTPESVKKQSNRNSLNRSKSSDNLVVIKKNYNGPSGIPISAKPKDSAGGTCKISSSAPNLTKDSFNDNVAFENWINLIEKTNATSLLADEEAFENWKRFLNSNNATRNFLSESKEKDAMKNWADFLNQGTPKSNTNGKGNRDGKELNLFKKS